MWLMASYFTVLVRLSSQINVWTLLQSVRNFFILHQQAVKRTGKSCRLKPYPFNCTPTVFLFQGERERERLGVYFCLCQGTLQYQELNLNFFLCKACSQSFNLFVFHTLFLGHTWLCSGAIYSFRFRDHWNDALGLSDVRN